MRCALALPNKSPPRSAAAHMTAAAMLNSVNLVRVCVFFIVCLIICITPYMNS
jgi:hypothetical protein